MVQSSEPLLFRCILFCCLIKEMLENKTHLKREESKIFSALSKEYKNPIEVQKFISTLEYNKKDTMRSAYAVYQKKTAHCMESSFLAAAICEHMGYPPLVLSLESQDGIDHVLFVYRNPTGWGSVTISSEISLRGRLPQYRSIRDLVWSYYIPYIDDSCRIIGYQMANLNDLSVDWRFSSQNLWKAERYLIEMPHRTLKSSDAVYEKYKERYERLGPVKLQASWL